MNQVKTEKPGVSMWTKFRDNSTAIAITKAVAWSVSIGVLYYLMCVHNPFATPHAWGVVELSSIRIALMLRCFVLINPFAAVGCAIGSYAYSIYQGKLLAGAYLVTPMIWAVFGFMAYRWSKKWGRSMKKDLIILTCLSFAVGVGTNMNIMAVGLLGEVQQAGLLVLMIDVLQHMATTLAGYFILVMPFEKTIRYVKERKATKHLTDK